MSSSLIKPLALSWSPCPSFAVIYYSSNSAFYVFLFRFIRSVVSVFSKVKLSKLIKIKAFTFTNDKLLSVKFSHDAINLFVQAQIANHIVCKYYTTVQCLCMCIQMGSLFLHAYAYAHAHTSVIVYILCGVSR